MRIETVEHKVYKFEELSEEAKEAVRQEFLRWRQEDECDLFSRDCEEIMSAEYGMDDLTVRYSLGYCQGDGLSFRGTVDIMEFLEYAPNKVRLEKEFATKELRTMKFLAGELERVRVDRIDSRYCHKYSVSFDYKGWIDCSYRDYDKLDELADKFLEFIKELIMNECDKLEDMGYDFFYEMSMEDVAEQADANEYEFYEDGRLF